MNDDMNKGSTPPPVLVVDLDGTLIRNDLMLSSGWKLCKKNPLYIFLLYGWLCKGRAWTKNKIAERVRLDWHSLSYNKKFLAWLTEQKRNGRILVMATGSSHLYATTLAKHLNLFDHVLATQKENLIGNCKAAVLTEKYGRGGFDYAGNSRQDIAVWRCARHAIAVNCRPYLANKVRATLYFE